MSRLTCLLALAATAVTAAAAVADDPIQVPSAESRWAPAGAGDSTQFRRHVVPLFSKLGCNMRSCHSSFQGQNGFRLSLFGFEPHLDREELLEADAESEGDGPRADLQSPADNDDGAARSPNSPA